MASAVTRGARVGIVATLAVAVSAALASYAGVSLLTGPDHPAAAEAGSAAADGVDDVVEVSLDDCGSAWRPGPAGWQQLTVRDVDSRPGEVRIVGTDAAHA